MTFPLISSLRYKPYPGEINTAEDFEHMNRWGESNIRRLTEEFAEWLRVTMAADRDRLLARFMVDSVETPETTPQAGRLQ